MNWKPRTVDILSIVYTVGYFIILGIAFFQPFPTANKEVLTVLLGILSVIMTNIVQSYFSRDSANSATATTIKAMADNSVAVPVVPKDQ